MSEQPPKPTIPATTAATPPATSPDPRAMLTTLRSLAPLPDRAQWDLVASWKTAHADGQLAGTTLADVALLLLQTLTEADGSLDMVAAELLRHHGEARHLDPLRAVRPKLRPRTGLRDWRLEVGRAIATIEARVAGRCECSVHAQHGAPVTFSGCTVEREETDLANYAVLYDVRCDGCGRRWRVTEQHGYHYPSFGWEALAQSSLPPG